MTKRKINKWVAAIGLTGCLSFFMQSAFCQQLQTITDRTDILIGEQIKLKIKATLPLKEGGLYRWLAVPDSLSHFEIVDIGKIDTINFKDNSKAVEQTIVITSFDSGRWMFPSLPLTFNGAEGERPATVQTDSFFVNVSYSPPDSTDQLRDIKPIIGVSVRDYFWYYVVAGALLLLLIAYLLVRYLKKKKKLQPLVFSRVSPFNEAMEALKNLDQLDLTDAAEIKIYHTRLSDIFKRYLSRKQSKDMLQQTTGDLLISVNNLQPDDLSQLATALRCADAVKFAKYLPGPAESADSLKKIKETINNIETNKSLNA